ncbi:MAG: hypothetical protein IJA80_08980 [Clostridia bacterium]|jgi:hypothetical protein|nr:hypothetical protein [Clostridia bacterium]
MREEKRVITVNDFEQNLLVNGINEFRNMLLEQGMPTEDVDKLLIKVIDAPPQRKRRFDREDR